MEQSASAEIQEEANAMIINVNENSESQREANSPRGNESQNGEVDREANLLGDRGLTYEIIKKLESVEPPLSPKCCIYRVPHDLRKLNEEAYTPKVISIGPFHRDNKRLKAMEKFKMRYFRRFVQQAMLDVENLVRTVRDMEEAVRRCYAETSNLSSRDYVEMILMDASFIIAFFLDVLSGDEEWSIDHGCTTFMEQLKFAVDMLLLENQLPFFVMEKLYNLAFPMCSNYHTSFTLLTWKFFEQYYQSQGITFHVPLDDPILRILHFCDLLRTCFLPPSNMLPERRFMFQTMTLPTASELDVVGVKFKMRSSRSLFDLKFTNGVLEIPYLNLSATTEPLFRNLMALEQCHYVLHAYVTDYILVLNSLINTSNDVDLLVQKNILNNTFRDSNAVTTMFNNLNQQVLVLDTNSDYYMLSEALNAFYELHRPHSTWSTLCIIWKHDWKATLARDYLSTPWRTASAVAAIILLMLTFMQTICSFISLP